MTAPPVLKIEGLKKYFPGGEGISAARGRAGEGG